MTGAPGSTRLVALGAGVALAVAVPATLLAQILDAVRPDGPGRPLTYALALVVLAAMALGGTAVGRHRPAAPALTGAAAGAIAIAVVLTVGIARRLVAGDPVAWATVPGSALVGIVLASAASTLTARGAGRKRP